MNKTVATAISGLAVLVALTACTTVTTEETAPSAASEPSPAATPSAVPVDLTTGAPPSGTDAALAWAALMGPDGEYAAAASYQAVLDEFGPVEPYATILEAELRHIDALVRQLEKAGVSVPDNPYSGLIPAPDDLLAAAQAWAEGEIKNVEMYDALISQSASDSLTRVLSNLRSASLESHLPLFELAAASGGTLTVEQMSAR